jgi:O-antigen/teichoic acid export membrane protein
MNLLKSTLKWGSLGSLFNFLLALFFAIILARTVGPLESGIFALSYLPVQLLSTFDGFAMVTILVQQKSISDTALWGFRRWFWYCGIAFFVFCALLAPLLAWYYHEPRLLGLTLLNACFFFISALGRIEDILMRRHLESKKMARADAYGTFIGGTIAAITATYYPQAFVLCIFWLLRILIKNLILRSYFTAPQKVTLDVATLKSLKGLMQSYTFAEIFSSLRLALPAFWIGKQHGAEVLAFFRLAQNTAQMPVSIIGDFLGKTLVGWVSKSTTTLGIQLKTINWAVSGILWLSFPFMVAFAVFPEEIIAVLYGKSWLPAAPLLRFLLLFVVLNSLLHFVTFLLHGLGKGNIDAKLHLIGFCAMLLCLFFTHTQPLNILVLATTLSLMPAIGYGFYQLQQIYALKNRFIWKGIGFVLYVAFGVGVLFLLKTSIFWLPNLIKLFILANALLLLWLASSFWIGKKYLLQFWKIFR